MSSHAERLEFAPPATNGHGRAFGLALLAHLVLIGAITLGVQWKRNSSTAAVEAELWSAVPEQAAPKPVATRPAPPPKPAPAPRPPAKVAKVPDAQIVLERERQKLEQEKLDAQKLAQQKLEQQKLEQEKREKAKIALEKKQEQERKLALEKKEREEEKKKREEEARRKLALKAEQEAKQALKLAHEEKEESIKLEIMRKDNMQRMAGLAGATGGPAATGTAQKSSGPSGTYAGRVSASVKPNIVFIDDTQDNPVALVEVRAAPDGTITSRKLLKSSGNTLWDDAVLKAIDKTAKLPRDVDNRVPPLLEINFRRRD